MRVALVRPVYAPRGGAEGYLWRLSQELARRGHRVEVVCARAAAFPPGVRVHLVEGAGGPLAHLRFALRAGRLLRSLAPDVAQSLSAGLCVQVYRVTDGLRQHLLRAAHPRMAPLLRPLPRYLLLQLLERRAVMGSRRVVAISALEARRLARAYPRAAPRLRVLYNAVDLERFHPRGRAHREEVRRALGLSPRERVGLFVGQEFRRKGLRTALEALFLARDVRLLVAGSGDPRPLRGLLERLGDRVRLLGEVARMDRLYGAVDFVVLPSRYDPFGNAHLEAMAAGLPVIASCRAGGSELVADGESGFVLRDPGDPVELARRMREVRPEMGSRSREIASAFSWERHLEQLLRLYEEVADGG